MKLLLVEDEPRVRGFLLDSFEREGFTTVSFTNFDDAKDYLEGKNEEGVDVAILDRILGNKDGAALIPVLKKNFPETRILVLSALSDPEERAKILDSGADDYQGKPYSLTELLSRVRALARRPKRENGKAKTTVLNVGNLEVNLLEHVAQVKGVSLDLSPKEFRVISILAREPGKVWSKFKLLDLVWQINLDLESNVVEATIRNIRRKLEQAKCTARIESKRHLGYWLET